MLKTKQKIALARAASSTICSVRPQGVGPGVGGAHATQGRPLGPRPGRRPGLLHLRARRVRGRNGEGAREVGVVGADGRRHRRERRRAHTLHFARFVGTGGRVIAIEPTDWAFDKLLTNMDLNPDLAPRIVARQILLSASSSDPLAARIYSSWQLHDDGALHEQHGGRLTPTTDATVRTLDDVLREERVTKVGLIKLDVDGNEWSVLQGARQTLIEQRPPIVMELAPYLFGEAEFDSMISLLSGLDYRFAEAESRRPVAEDPAEIRASIRNGASLKVLLESRSR